MRSKKDIFDLGKKMTVDKGEKYRYLLCEKPLLNEVEKRKKELEGQTSKTMKSETFFLFF